MKKNPDSEEFDTLHDLIADVKRNDLLTAIEIAGLAGMPTRDRRGNVLPTIWTKQVQNMERETGVLLEANDMRKLLLEHLRESIEKRQPLLMELDSTEPLVRWICETTRDWEKHYCQKLSEKYDISSTIYACMQEVVFEILPYLLSLSNKTSEDAINAVRNRLKILKERAKREVANNNTLQDFRHNLFFNEERAVVRMLFRHPAARETLVRLAGKLLQRKEVCNKPGSYSARTQRNDIVQEYNDAVNAFCASAESNPTLLQGLLRDLTDLQAKNIVDLYYIDHSSIERQLHVRYAVQDTNSENAN